MASSALTQYATYLPLNVQHVNRWRRHCSNGCFTSGIQVVTYARRLRPLPEPGLLECCEVFLRLGGCLRLQAHCRSVSGRSVHTLEVRSFVLCAVPTCVCWAKHDVCVYMTQIKRMTLERAHTVFVKVCMFVCVWCFFPYRCGLSTPTNSRIARRCVVVTDVWWLWVGRGSIKYVPLLHNPVDGRMKLKCTSGRRTGRDQGHRESLNFSEEILIRRRWRKRNRNETESGLPHVDR